MTVLGINLHLKWFSIAQLANRVSEGKRICSSSAESANQALR